MALVRSLSVPLGLVLSIALAGCGNSGPGVSSSNPTGNHRFNGIVHGGQQPVAGSTIQLYTVGTTGDGSAATPLLTKTVTTDAGGNFDITGLYSCTNATQVYITATGGNPGASSANPNLAMMAALGPCTSITASTFIFIDELTTVAATSALAPYMTSPTAIGSATSDAASLAAAFTLADELVDTSTGSSPGVGVPSGFAVPTAQLNTLADILAACVNSTGGTSGDGSPCGNLFSLTTIGSNPAPTDALTAMLNLANDPSQNTTALYALIPASAPFQPTLTSAPPYFQTGLSPTSSNYSGFQVAPTSLNFAPEPVGTAAPPLNLFYLNSGSAVNISSIRIVGPNASDFSLADTCQSTGFTGFCILEVNATPSTAGTGTAYIVVESTDPYSPQYIALTDTGSVPSDGSITLTPSLTFNVSNALQDLTLSNNSSSLLAIQSITETDSGASASPYAAGPFFSIAQNTCGSSLAANSSCTITVLSSQQQRSSSTDDTVVGAVTVTDNAVNGSQSSALTSTNIFSVNNLSGGIVTFPSTDVGSSQSSGPYFYTKEIVTPAPPVTLALSGANPGDFSVSTTDAQGNFPDTSCSGGAGGSYGEGQYCNIMFSFTPTSAGARSAKAAINPSGTGITGQYVLLKGTGVGP